MASVVPNSEATQFKAGEKQVEIARMGGIASGEAKREKKRLRKELETLLDSTNSKGKNYGELISLGLIANAIDKNKGGNPKAFELIAKMVGEMDEEENRETPSVQINIVDNTDLEKVMYEDKQ